MAGMKYCNGSWVEVDLNRLKENVQSMAGSLGRTALIAVVKSDAYGHGLTGMVRGLERAGVRNFAVAYAAEAEEVRRVAPEAERIIVLGVVDPTDVPQLRQARITPVVVSLEQARVLSAAALDEEGNGAPLEVHLKLDTGMGRLGFVCPDDLAAAQEVLRLPGLRVTGVCTHFAIVEPVRHPEAAGGQRKKFAAAVEALERVAGRPLFRHMSSSRAALLMPECDQNGVRIGISLYGYGSTDPELRFSTRPILQWKSRVMQVKRVPAGFAVGYYGAYVTKEPTDLAVISCGYTDGYLRHLGNTGHVLIGGKRRLVAGRVSMNWLTADLGPNSGVKAGDEVVLLGEQGDEAVWADELARHCGTIAYEILTDISRQIERRYLMGTE